MTMKVLFLHQNFPGQFLHLAGALAERGAVEAAAIGGPTARARTGVELIKYELGKSEPAVGHPYARRFTFDCTRGDHAAKAMRLSAQRGFVPDLTIGHVGWGDPLFVKDVFPDTRFLAYSEFFYSARGADVGFDPEFADREKDLAPLLRSRNAAIALGLLASDRGLVPTHWQRQTHPPPLAERLSVIHDGIDTAAAHPDPAASIELPNGPTLRAGMEIVTYVARGLEPYRGFHIFMRALPDILAHRPEARILIIGSDPVSYGAPPRTYKSWRQAMLADLGSRIDRTRVHFLGQVAKSVLLRAMQVSSCHVYLTYPFVLSWSMLEAMACGCIVVGSATPPVAEVVRDGENGLLCDFFDPHALAERVVEVLTTPGRFTHLREAARRSIVENYDLKTVCLPRQMALIDELMAGRG